MFFLDFFWLFLDCCQSKVFYWRGESYLTIKETVIKLGQHWNISLPIFILTFHHLKGQYPEILVEVRPKSNRVGLTKDSKPFFHSKIGHFKATAL
jgi:hypothetical protein